MLLSPKGKITRYLYGISYDEFNVRSALYEAADGEIGNTIDKVVMYCYQYDPDSGSYTPVAINIMKLGGLATLIFLGIFLGSLWLREKRKKQTSKTEFN
jgi:protein SCO1/2